jgi:hypothetical protein
MLNAANRMVNSSADLVCNGAEAGAHLLGAAKVHARTVEENAETSASLSALENLQRVAERFEAVQKFEQANPQSIAAAKEFLAQVAANRAAGLSPYAAAAKAD